MVKTTIDLREDLYREIVEIAIERYGNANKISEVLNELLENVLQKKKGWKVEVTVKLNKKVDLSPEKVKEMAQETWIE